MIRRPKFSIRAMFIATSVFSIALSAFLAVYTFTSVQSSAITLSPDGQYTLKLEAKNHWNLIRRWTTVESTLYANAPATAVAMKNFHYLGSSEIPAMNPSNYRELGPDAISWEKSSIACTYRVTDLDVATIEIANNRWQPAKITQVEPESSDNKPMNRSGESTVFEN